jgi:hypothetical protein
MACRTWRRSPKHVKECKALQPLGVHFVDMQDLYPRAAGHYAMLLRYLCDLHDRLNILQSLLPTFHMFRTAYMAPDAIIC